MRLGLSCAAGRPPGDVLDVLRRAGLLGGEIDGVTPPAFVEVTRPAASSAAAHSWLLAPAADVLVACECGALDAGVVGKEVLLERGAEVHELLDLGVPADALVHAVRPRPGARRRARSRVATSYPRVAHRHFADAGLQVEVVEFSIPVLAVGLGLADAVVELRSVLDLAAGLELERREQVAACSARLVSGRAARTLAGAALAGLVEGLRASGLHAGRRQD